TETSTHSLHDALPISDYKGKKILIVNTASECGFTSQYADLEELSNTYKDKLVVIGFPANNFGGQEPGSNEEIGAFCQKNFGVTRSEEHTSELQSRENL